MPNRLKARQYRRFKLFLKRVDGSACGGSPPGVAIYGTPAVSNVPVLGDLVYIAGYNGKVFAYDAKTLQTRDGYIRSTAILRLLSATIAVSGDILYFGCTDDNLYALDTATGDFKMEIHYRRRNLVLSDSR